MRLALYASTPRNDAPNLVALQDETLAALPTVLVCPLKAGLAVTALRVELRWGDGRLVACPELARPIRRSALRPLGYLDETNSRAVMGAIPATARSLTGARCSSRLRAARGSLISCACE